METLKQKGKNQNTLRTVILYVVLALVATFIIISFLPSTNDGEVKKLSEVLTLIKEDKVKEVKIDESTVNVQLKDDTKIKATKEEGVGFSEILKDAGIDPKSFPWSVRDTSTSKTIFSLAALFLPVLIIVGFFIFFLRQARGAGDNLLSFARSRAKTFNKDKPIVKFTEVAGVEEAKRELQEVVQFLKHPEKFRALGAKIPKGVLLVGPSGVGKTLLARAVAGEAEVPFFSIAGSEFMEMLVGVGASRGRDFFENAKKTAPAIIFIDEIDSIGRQRGLGIGGGHDEREQTLNQILTEMDGFEPNDNVIVIAATNRPDMLDPALVRPGRFDRRGASCSPDIYGRTAIIKIHSRNKPLAPNVNIDKIARRTVGFSGADLENMLNEAAILAAG